MRGLKDIRWKTYNYGSDGYYFVTIVARSRERVFTNREQEVEKELTDLVGKTKGLNLDYSVTMPNHVHIIFVLEDCQLKLGEVVRRFKAKVSHRFGGNMWQPNYYEHVIRTEKALDKIREYIVNNPQAELLKFEEFYK